MIRLAFGVRRADAETALAELLAFAPAGVEESDVSDALVEYAIYAPSETAPGVDEIRAALGEALVSVTSTTVADDWSERWREFHQPLRLGGRLLVRPPWIAPDDSAIDLVIDPAQAFGTGAHPTTALCLEMLLEMPVPMPSFHVHAPGLIDLGCGSGVLAILAAKLGWSNVLALDYDPLAVEATVENARVNGVELFDVRRFDLLDEDVPIAPVVLANLLAPLLKSWCERMARSDEKRPQTIIASGLLATEIDAVSLAFAQVGYTVSERKVQGEWAALMLRRSVG